MLNDRMRRKLIDFHVVTLLDLFSVLYLAFLFCLNSKKTTLHFG